MSKRLLYCCPMLILCLEISEGDQGSIILAAVTLLIAALSGLELTH